MLLQKISSLKLCSSFSSWETASSIPIHFIINKSMDVKESLHFVKESLDVKESFVKESRCKCSEIDYVTLAVWHNRSDHLHFGRNTCRTLAECIIWTLEVIWSIVETFYVDPMPFKTICELNMMFYVNITRNRPDRILEKNPQKEKNPMEKNWGASVF